MSDWGENKPSCLNYFDRVVRCYGYLCAASNVGALGYVAWVGTNDLTDSLAANISLTSLYVLTDLYLNFSAIPETAVVIGNLFRNIVTANYQPTLSDRLTPKLSFCLKSFGLITAGLSYGPSVVISQDYFGRYESLAIFMEITLSCASVFLVAMSILSITDQILEFKVEKMGSIEEKKLVAIHKKMKMLSLSLSSIPMFEFALFLKELSPETINCLTEESGITSTDLTEYIEGQKAHINHST